MQWIMDRNQSINDRAVRVVGGLAILSMAFFGPHTLWGFLGVIPLFSGMIAFDPIYAALGFSTRRERSWIVRTRLKPAPSGPSL